MQKRILQLLLITIGERKFFEYPEKKGRINIKLVLIVIYLVSNWNIFIIIQGNGIITIHNYFGILRYSMHSYFHYTIKLYKFVYIQNTFLINHYRRRKIEKNNENTNRTKLFLQYHSDSSVYYTFKVVLV